MEFFAVDNFDRLGVVSESIEANDATLLGRKRARLLARSGSVLRSSRMRKRERERERGNPSFGLSLS